MFIQRVIIKNYRCLQSADVTFNERLNVIVGNNECGKSTLLEAIHLALTGQLNGRPLQLELHPHLFNREQVLAYIENLQAGGGVGDPEILIEVYLADDPALASLKGTNNSRGVNSPGVRLCIKLHPEHAEDFSQYTDDPSDIRALPIEYYGINWHTFADNEIKSGRSIPLRSSLIDASTIKNNVGASRYVTDIVKESLTRQEQVGLALSYRLMKDHFLGESSVQKMNEALALKQGRISEKKLSISLDATTRANWEAGVMPHLDDIPLTLVGKGEQNAVKIKLALETSARSNIILIEEIENHLSYGGLNALIGHISAHAGTRQIFITTHSSFVLNKLGIESVLLFHRGKGLRINELGDPTTRDYFMKLPGHDTLRLILATRAILVEGPSDELIVQRAYRDRHGRMPLEDGVDVISVNSLAFKRFLEIAVRLNKTADVVTDNDGSVATVRRRYADYLSTKGVSIHYDTDESARTLEPQLLKKNGLATINAVLAKSFATGEQALEYMQGNKAETALRFFETPVAWRAPDYIANALH